MPSFDSKLTENVKDTSMLVSQELTNTEESPVKNRGLLTMISLPVYTLKVCYDRLRSMHTCAKKLFGNQDYFNGNQYGLLKQLIATSERG